MTFEAILASLHLLAILTLVVFLSSETALCRVEWMNEAVVRRLARLNCIFGWTLLILTLTGLARVFWGIKGTSWYVSQPLFHLKMLLFVITIALATRPMRTLRQWMKTLQMTGALPDPEAVRSTRRWLMVQAHLIPVIAVIAVFWVRGM